MAAIIGYISMLIGTVGIFFGFFYLSHHPNLSIQIITFCTVGIVGILAFVRHFIFQKSDAKRLGWETDRPEWVFEVGFANLAFGIIGILTSYWYYSAQTQAVIVLGYAIYLLQAGLLHGYIYFTDGKKSAARLWRSCAATLLYSGMMSFFALRILLFQK
ncbi:MAG: hypothetical protein C0407_08055 [Desulfobacca sp.]|nr:hypothetical protein [Desulfobacca sp.]